MEMAIIYLNILHLHLINYYQAQFSLRPSKSPQLRYRLSLHKVTPPILHNHRPLTRLSPISRGRHHHRHLPLPLIPKSKTSIHHSCTSTCTPQSHPRDILLHPVHLLRQGFELFPVDGLASGREVVARLVAAVAERFDVGCAGRGVFGVALACALHGPDIFAEHDVATASSRRGRFLFFGWRVRCCRRRFCFVSRIGFVCL